MLVKPAGVLLHVYIPLVLQNAFTLSLLANTLGLMYTLNRAHFHVFAIEHVHA